MVFAKYFNACINQNIKSIRFNKCFLIQFMLVDECLMTLLTFIHLLYSLWSFSGNADNNNQPLPIYPDAAFVTSSIVIGIFLNQLKLVNFASVYTKIKLRTYINVFQSFIMTYTNYSIS